MALIDSGEYTQRYLARGWRGEGVAWAGWQEQQKTARTVFEMCGQQSRVHYHLFGEPCNERCDVYPPLPEAEHEPQVVASAEPKVETCSHQVSLQVDCGECNQEARLGLRKLISGKAGEREPSSQDGPEVRSELAGPVHTREADPPGDASNGQDA